MLDVLGLIMVTLVTQKMEERRVLAVPVYPELHHKATVNNKVSYLANVSQNQCFIPAPHQHFTARKQRAEPSR